MRTTRVIPCLDVDRGRVVKGVNFVGLRDAGDPVELAARYDAEGADEIVFLDITASSDGRDTMIDVARRTAESVFIPFTIGGGVRSVDDARRLLRAGADKVSLNTSAVEHPELLTAIATEFGAQCVVCAIDARRQAAQPLAWEVYVHGGRTATCIDGTVDVDMECLPRFGYGAVDGHWEGGVLGGARAVSDGLAVGRGAGEILLTSMDRDGTREGFDLELTRAVADAVNVPVIASGGVGTLDHLVDGVLEGGADALLAASIFHFGEYTVAEVKQALAARGVSVRPVAA